jgi:quercetin dioxygenase-like cupin family protein
VSEVAVTRWTGAEPPAREAIETAFREERLSPSWWSNAPGVRYSAHSHAYHKVLYCAAGAIRFTMAGGETIDLAPGDRLDIPPRTVHSAIVGPEGVNCAEAARR